MFEKEILTKKKFIKFIMPRTSLVLIETVLLWVCTVLLGLTSSLFFLVNKDICLVVLNIFGIFFSCCTLASFICSIFYLMSPIYTLINLHRGKYYIVEAPLKSKSQRERYDPLAGRRGRYYIEYSFHFDKLGTFRTPYGYVFYPFSKYDKMEPKMADIITEPGEEFYLLFYGKKKKKIVAIFHKKLFELQKDEFTQLYNRYYI